MGAGNYPYSAASRQAACCRCCSNCKPRKDTIVSGSLPCGASVEATIPETGHLKVRVTASHTFHRSIYDGVELTITRSGIKPLIEYLERAQRSL